MAERVKLQFPCSRGYTVRQGRHFETKTGKRYVDVVVYEKGKPILFIETKNGPKAKYNDHQLMVDLD